MDLGYLKVRNYEEKNLDVSEIGRHYVLSFSQKEYVKVSEEAKKIIEEFDGTKTLDEIILALEKNNIYISKCDLEKFINDYLLKNNLIESNLSNNTNKSYLWFHLPLLHGDKLKKIFSPLKFLFKTKTVLFLLPAMLIMHICFFSMGIYSSNGQIDLYNLNSIGIIGITFISCIFHEIGHTVAAFNYNVIVGDMGIGMYIFRPVLYTDLSNSWNVDRKKRVIIDLGGVYFQFIYLSLTTLVLVFIDASTVKVASLLVFISLLGNLNPLLRFDGYWIVTDLLGLVNVHKRAVDFFKGVISSLFKGKIHNIKLNFNLKRKLKIVLYVYISLYILLTISALGGGIYLLIKIVNNPETITNVFTLLWQSIISKNIGSIFNRLNNAIIVILPIIYFLLLIASAMKKFIADKAIRQDKAAPG